MSGEGHAGWLAAVAFHPQARSAGRMLPARTVQVLFAQSADGPRPGAAMASLGTGSRPWPDGRGRPAPQATLLASAAGDAAVKLWSFALRRCVCTLRGAGLACRARPVSAAAAAARRLHARQCETCGRRGLVMQARQRPGRCARPVQALRAPFKASSASSLRVLWPPWARPPLALAQGTARAFAVSRSMRRATSWRAHRWMAARACGTRLAARAGRRSGARRAPRPLGRQRVGCRARSQPAACGAGSTCTRPWLSRSRSARRWPSRAVSVSQCRIRTRPATRGVICGV